MAYDATLAARIRDLFARRRRAAAEKRMFGGVGFLLDGNLAVGVWQESLVARVGPDAADAAADDPHARPFDPAGRPFRGWLLIDPDGIDADAALAEWIDRATAFADTLPPK